MKKIKKSEEAVKDIIVIKGQITSIENKIENFLKDNAQTLIDIDTKLFKGDE